ncbi:hypothetical protein [Actinomadura miaoliensis]|uniref:Uncharacterized protein n=1 Tax=Actinomadura miaoliensis TaxID=430685 RepID=A0ABP7V4N3_9ACTN
MVLDISAKEEEAIFVDRGEWSALSSVLAQLETRMPEIFTWDYQEQLQAARVRPKPMDED